MARNGSGTYNLPAGNPVVTGTAISSTWANTTLGDMATALTGSIASDGQTTPTANLPMGNFAHTGVANATNRTMYAAAGQVQDNVFQYLTSVSGADTITAVASYGMTGYVTGQRFTFISAGANTGAVTLNINSIGAKAVTKNGTTALAAGDIASGMAVTVTYDGTQFQLNNVSSSTLVSSFSAGATGLTPSTATTGAVTLAGTLNVANGGTGVTTLTANNVILGNGTSAVQAVAPSTSGNVLTSNGTTWVSQAIPSQLTVATAQVLSGTTNTFSGIPSTAKRITVIMNGASSNGSDALLIKLGTAGGIVSSGYISSSGTVGGTSTSTNGFVVRRTANADEVSGIMTLAKVSGNTWISSHSVDLAAPGNPASGGGNVTLSGTLTQLQFALSGSNTFDAGSVNIMYE